MRVRRNKPVPMDTYEEAVADANRYRAQALRLKESLDQVLHDHAEELRKLQSDNSWLMYWNAGLALELAEKDWEVSQLKGEC